ncbi:MAG: hypothetical protein ACQEP9_01730 [Bacillota bacterium]
MKELTESISDSSNRVQEKVFYSRDTKGMVARDIIKDIKGIINNSNSIKNKHYISYETVKNIEGEYFLSRSDANLEPLRNYLANNQVSIETIINWLETILNLFQVAKDSSLSWEGITPASLWVGEDEQIFIVDPQVTNKISHYREEVEFDWSDKLLLPPEILEGQAWDDRAQIYSIVSFFYYLLTDKPLFSDKEDTQIMAKIKKIKPLNPQTINAKLSGGLNNLLMECLAKGPNERPTSFGEVLKVVTRLKNSDQLRSSKKRQQEIKNKQSIQQQLFKIKESLFWFWYKYGKLSVIMVIIISVLTVFVLSGGYEPIIDEHTKEKQVVNYFYEGIDTKNINLLEETIDISQISHIKGMVMNGYIIEASKKLLSNRPPSAHKEEIKENSAAKQKSSTEDRLFKIENLEINKITDTPQQKYRASYQFVFIDQDKTAKIKMEDQIILDKVKDKWKIKKIAGDITGREFLRKKEEKLEEN